MPLFNPRCSPAGARVPTPVSQMRELRPLLEECCSERFTSADSGNLSRPPLSPFYRCHLAGWGLPWSRCRGAVKEAKESLWRPRPRLPSWPGAPLHLQARAGQGPPRSRFAWERLFFVPVGLPEGPLRLLASLQAQA